MRATLGNVQSTGGEAGGIGNFCRHQESRAVIFFISSAFQTVSRARYRGQSPAKTCTRLHRSTSPAHNPVNPGRTPVGRSHPVAGRDQVRSRRHFFTSKPDKGAAKGTARLMAVAQKSGPTPADSRLVTQGGSIMEEHAKRRGRGHGIEAELRDARLALETRGARSWTRGTPIPTGPVDASKQPDELDLAMQRQRRQVLDLQARFGGVR